MVREGGSATGALQLSAETFASSLSKARVHFSRGRSRGSCCQQRRNPPKGGHRHKVRQCPQHLHNAAGASARVHTVLSASVTEQNVVSSEEIGGLDTKQSCKYLFRFLSPETSG